LLELWIDGVFRASALTDHYRPELQALFGGSGLFGFTITLPWTTEGGGPNRAELREASSGLVVDVLQLRPQNPPAVDEAVVLRRELAEVRAALRRIEQRLPDFNSALSFRLEHYRDYFAQFYGSTDRSRSAAVTLSDVAVIIDAASCTGVALNRAIEGVCQQGQKPGAVLVAHSGGDLTLDYEHVLKLWRGCFDDAASPRAVVAEGGWATRLRSAVSTANAPFLLLTDAHTRLAPDASHHVAGALSRGAALVYADSDVVDLGPDGSEGPHRTPAFRASFDADLFLQQGDVGPLVGFSRTLLDAVSMDPAREPSGLYDVILRALGERERGERQWGDFVHIPRILSHRADHRDDEPDLADRRQALDAHLADWSPGAVAVPHEDPLGAALPRAFRVRRPLPPYARAAVIVPTRDRLDLLEPCLASLEATESSNDIKLEILVIDNQSHEPQTLAFFQRAAHRPNIRIIPYDGAFNWALMNNRAALETEADVLIFLNNDTTALTADWCDELCSQALRPEIGAVGARLLYSDGTIQHAGIVTGGVHAFAAHEGVGAPPGDSGYLGRHSLLREVSAVTGACMATRRSVFLDHGGFDAVNLPVESNDVDYCFRLRSAGLKVLYDPYCTFYHYESKSRGSNIDPDKHAKAEAAGAYLRRRWGDIYGCDPFYNPHFDRDAEPFTRLRPPVYQDAAPPNA
jgi:GT2 family glycosyltransferase